MLKKINEQMNDAPFKTKWKFEIRMIESKINAKLNKIPKFRGWTEKINQWIKYDGLVWDQKKVQTTKYYLYSFMIQLLLCYAY